MLASARLEFIAGEDAPGCFWTKVVKASGAKADL
jgi:hypothetical protein